MKQAKKRTIPATLIAPCGMNCILCHAYRREKNVCPGCRSDDRCKAKTRVTCKIKNCQILRNRRLTYCYRCESFPCAALNHLDDRYRTKYAMSMIDNLKSIEELGIRRFTRKEAERWACPECGAIICVHKENCIQCGHKWR